MSASDFNIGKKILVARASTVVSLGGARGCSVLPVLVARAEGLEASSMRGTRVSAAGEGNVSWLVKPRCLEEL